MIRICFTTLMCLALVFPAASAATHEEEAVETVERYHAALAGADTATAMGLLADDVVVLESGWFESREEYISHHLGADMSFAAAVSSKRGDVHAVVVGNAAWVSSTSHTRGAWNDREINSIGAELIVLSRTDGVWKIRAIHWSSRSAE
jgi:ketosteroid isomerase-like protein